MIKTPAGVTPKAAIDRAEALVDRFGQRVREARAAAERKEKEVVAQADTAAGPPQPVRPAGERADELLDRTGESLGRLASDVSLRIRKAAAVAREEAEDMLAEAQHLCQSRRS